MTRLLAQKASVHKRALPLSRRGQMSLRVSGFPCQSGLQLVTRTSAPPSSPLSCLPLFLLLFPPNNSGPVQFQVCTTGHRASWRRWWPVCDHLPSQSLSFSLFPWSFWEGLTANHEGLCGRGGLIYFLFHLGLLGQGSYIHSATRRVAGDMCGCDTS